MEHNYQKILDRLENVGLWYTSIDLECIFNHTNINELKEIIKYKESRQQTYSYPPAAGYD